MIKTKRELVQAVKAAMDRQGWKRAASRSGLCQYRACDGRKCAIGCLVPDENYREDFEGLSLIESDVFAEHILAAANVTRALKAEAIQLQLAHDDATDDADWKVRFAEWARA